jgi:hypothetical protein
MPLREDLYGGTGAARTTTGAALAWRSLLANEAPPSPFGEDFDGELLLENTGLPSDSLLCYRHIGASLGMRHELALRGLPTLALLNGAPNASEERVL